MNDNTDNNLQVTAPIHDAANDAPEDSVVGADVRRAWLPDPDAEQVILEARAFAADRVRYLVSPEI